MINFISNRFNQFGIKTRIVAIILCTQLLLVVLFVCYSFYSLSAKVDSELVDDANTIGTILAESSRLAVGQGNYDSLQQTLNGIIVADHNLRRIEVLDAQRNIILVKKSGNMRAEEGRQFSYAIQSDTISSANQQAVLGYIQLYLTPELMTADLVRHIALVSAILLVFALSSGLFALWLSRSITVPLQLAMNALKIIRGGQYHQQVEVTTKGEIGQLQETINQIAISFDEYKIELENKVQARTIELQRSRDVIAKADSEKRRLIQKVQSIVEEERKSIAAEIHDELNATLIAAKLSSQRILSMTKEEDINHNAAQISEHAQHIIQLTSNLYTSARNIVRRLRPEILDMLGLQGAINDVIENYQSMQLQCHFTFSPEGDLSNLPTGLDITVYRLVQEALSNVIKHAGATHTSVRIKQQGELLQVSVIDNGCGFDIASTESGIGIIGMRERVYAFHGQFKIESEVGVGTTLRADFPM